MDVLATDQHGLADTFARSRTNKFADVALTTRAHGSPALNGAAAWIDCELRAEYDGGDHTHSPPPPRGHLSVPQGKSRYCSIAAPMRSLAAAAPDNPGDNNPASIDTHRTRPDVRYRRSTIVPAPRKMPGSSLDEEDR